MKRRVVVTGIGIITALGVGEKSNCSKIFSGVSGINEITVFDAKKFPGQLGGEAREFSVASLYNLSSKRLDRASHLLIHATREALFDAEINDTIKAMPVLLSLGTTLGGMLSGEEFHKEVLKKGLERARLNRLSDYPAQCQAINLLKEFGLRGDFRMFSNACASGTNAIGHAFKSLRSGQYDIALCGGYDTMSEFTFAGFNSLLAMSSHLCRPFDKNRDGLVLGEGVGILILEELEHAVQRGAPIIGEVVGYGESSDAYHVTSPDPSGKGAAIAIMKAFDDAGGASIDYLNAHGTGTPHNDVMESRAINLALGERAKEIPVSSIKPMIGHLLGAAGAVEAIVSLLAIRQKSFPPNINFETPDPECVLNIVTQPGEKCNIRTVLSNSFGFGGSNAAIILKEYRWEG